LKRISSSLSSLVTQHTFKNIIFISGRSWAIQFEFWNVHVIIIKVGIPYLEQNVQTISLRLLRELDILFKPMTFYCTDEEFKRERKMCDCLLKGKRR
jgi:hypothetical protein